MSLKPVYATEATLLSTTLNSLANGAADSSSEQDNSTARILDARIDVEMAAAGANTGLVAVYLLEGSATGKLSTTAQLANMRYIGSLQLNGTTVARKSFFAGDMPKFYTARVVNNSGGALAATLNTVKLTGVNYEDV